jgi:hypothetical protein
VRFMRKLSNRCPTISLRRSTGGGGGVGSGPPTIPLSHPHVCPFTTGALPGGHKIAEHNLFATSFSNSFARAWAAAASVRHSHCEFGSGHIATASHVRDAGVCVAESSPQLAKANASLGYGQPLTTPPPQVKITDNVFASAAEQEEPAIGSGPAFCLSVL